MTFSQQSPPPKSGLSAFWAVLNRQLQLWPFFDRLRGNPRFDALLEG